MQPTLLVRALIAGFLLVTSLAAGESPSPATLEELQSRIREHLDQPRFRPAGWGIKVESLDTGVVLFEHQAGKLFKPASNAKLFTGALALDRLGPDYRLRTSCYAAERPSRSGTIRGDLYVYGGGDFSFAARFNDGDYAASLRPLVQALQRAGVRRVRGSLVGDGTYFTGPPFGASWTWDDLQYYYGAEVSALVHEDNVVDLLFKPGARVGDSCRIETQPRTTYFTLLNHSRTVAAGSPRFVRLQRELGQNLIHVTGQLPVNGTNWVDAAPVHDGALWFVSQLRQDLAQQGIRVSDPPRSVAWLSDPETRPDYRRMVEVASVTSPPLAVLVTRMMKPSQNLYAQALLLQVGKLRERNQPPGAGEDRPTEDLGLAELRDFAREAGIPAEDLLLDEGSGLSRRALLTPNALVTLLKYMRRHRHGAVFEAALPVAGVDGTLRSRMRGTPAERNLRAKTGTLAQVYTLSGYVTTAAGEPLVFSLMLNNHTPDSTAAARQDVDALAVLLAAFRGRSEAR